MGREIVMVGICTLMVIGLAWGIDHPKKDVATWIALGAFVGMVLMAYVKSRNIVPRKSGRLIVRDRRRDGSQGTGGNPKDGNDEEVAQDERD